MAEYIDKNEIMLFLNNPQSIRDVTNFIAKLKPEDVVPVIHGKWIEEEIETYVEPGEKIGEYGFVCKRTRRECSNCGKGTDALWGNLSVLSPLRS